MDLNSTMLVQVAHFAVAYLILDRVFIRIAVAHVRAEERALASLEQQVKEQQSRVADRIHHNEQNWLILKKRLRAECPEMKKSERVLGSHGEDRVAERPPVAEEVGRMAKRLEECIVRAVIHE